MTSQHVLIVEDDALFAASLNRILSLHGYTSSLAATLEEMQQILQLQAPDVLILDLMLGQESTQNHIKTLRQTLPSALILVLTGLGSIASAVKAMQDGASSYLCKPLKENELLAALQQSPEPNPASQVETSLWELEQQHIEQVLQDCGGNITQAALKLGLHRRTLQRKLKRIL